MKLSKSKKSIWKVGSSEYRAAKTIKPTLEIISFISFWWEIQRQGWYQTSIIKTDIQDLLFFYSSGLIRTCYSKSGSFRCMATDASALVSLFQAESFVCSVAKSCPILCVPMNCRLPVSSVRGRILEQVAISFSKGLMQSLNLLHCRQILNH